MVLCFGNENAKIMADVIGKGGIETYYASERETLNALMKKYITRKDVVLVIRENTSSSYITKPRKSIIESLLKN
jgi:hypothetical protein